MNWSRHAHISWHDEPHSLLSGTGQTAVDGTSWFSNSEQPVYRNVRRFRGGLVFQAHKLLHHSTPGCREIKKKKWRIQAGFSVALLTSNLLKSDQPLTTHRSPSTRDRPPTGLPYRPPELSLTDILSSLADILSSRTDTLVAWALADSHAD